MIHSYSLMKDIIYNPNNKYDAMQQIIDLFLEINGIIDSDIRN
tara:strand:- start:341 stop:469 length:129 start_codon:yes stop_codon:yes gene_type:complete